MEALFAAPSKTGGSLGVVRWSADSITRKEGVGMQGEPLRLVFKLFGDYTEVGTEADVVNA